MILTIMICLYRVSTEPQKFLTGVLIVKKHLLKTTKDTYIKISIVLNLKLQSCIMTKIGQFENKNVICRQLNVLETSL